PDALGDARGPRPGLRANGPREGTVRARGDRGARAEERALADRDAHRLAARRVARRRRGDRDGVRVARYRIAGARRDLEEGLSGGAGGGGVRRRRLHRDQHGARPALRLPRPPAEDGADVSEVLGKAPTDVRTLDSPGDAPRPSRIPLADRRPSGRVGVRVWRAVGPGGVVVAAVVLLALLAPVLAPHSLGAFDLTHRLSPPIWDARGNWTHPLGTDTLG